MCCPSLSDCPLESQLERENSPELVRQEALQGSCKHPGILQTSRSTGVVWWKGRALSIQRNTHLYPQEIFAFHPVLQTSWSYRKSLFTWLIICFLLDWSSICTRKSRAVSVWIYQGHQLAAQVPSSVASRKWLSVPDSSSKCEVHWHAGYWNSNL